MSVRKSAVVIKTRAAVSRIGQHRQIVIPKPVFDSLGLVAGDVVEITKHRRGLLMKPRKSVEADDTLTPSETRKVKRGEAELRRGQSRPWRTVRNELVG